MKIQIPRNFRHGFYFYFNIVKNFDLSQYLKFYPTFFNVNLGYEISLKNLIKIQRKFIKHYLFKRNNFVKGLILR